MLMPISNQITIPINQLTIIKCPVCKHENFNLVHRLRKLPPVYSPTGKADMIIENLFQCDNCFAIYTKDILINQKTEKDAK